MKTQSKPATIEGMEWREGRHNSESLEFGPVASKGTSVLRARLVGASWEVETGIMSGVEVNFLLLAISSLDAYILSNGLPDRSHE